ncbi:MAG: hemerythrin domain-containing protein [Abitibacteriaceae bacterium]|nr:hemerythrin domain-containing protein [Abditibacteriaceae bacterium]MBV9867421.1 hemerythrin domain-containing protein [Abditibacteriaceae bacterium]
MNENGNDRRDFLRMAGAMGVGLVLPTGLGSSEAAENLDPDKGVTASEDLMKEHGVLNRCLLIYEAGIQRLRNKEEVSPQVFNHTAALIRSFVEEYHEKNEEEYIFPVFEQHKKLVGLVETLKAQHIAGRKVTAQVLHFSAPTQFRSAENRAHLIASCESFIRMYRPHESREDTVLFPALRTILTPNQVTALGDKMEGDEHKVLGDEGFEKSVAQVESIEKALGIYDIKQFTPKV